MVQCHLQGKLPHISETQHYDTMKCKMLCSNWLPLVILVSMNYQYVHSCIMCTEYMNWEIRVCVSVCVSVSAGQYRTSCTSKHSSLADTYCSTKNNKCKTTWQATPH